MILAAVAPMNTGTLILWAIASGAAFSLLGISYRRGQTKGLTTRPIAFYMSMVGFLFFAFRAWGAPLGDVPAYIWVMGFSSALSQYIVIRLISTALKKGPLSPVSCALSVGFLPVGIYSYFRFDEPLGILKILGIAAGFACVAAGSFSGHHDETVKNPQHKASRQLIYGLLLLAVLISNCLAPIILKEVGMRRFAGGENYIERFGNVFFGCWYGSIALLFLLDIVLSSELMTLKGAAVRLGLLAGAGSTCGVAIAGMCAAYSAAVYWTTNGVVMMVLTAIVSVIAFKEKVSPALFAPVSLGVLAVILVGL